MSEPRNAEQYYVPEQSPYPLLASIAVALMLVGAASWFNDLKANSEQASPLILTFGFMGLCAVLYCWFRASIVENLQGLANFQLKRSYRLAMQWFIFSEVMFFITFFSCLLYLRALVGPWLESQGLWGSFQYQWPMLDTPQEAVGIANQPVANSGEFTGAAQSMAWPGVANMFAWLPLWNTLLLVTSSVTLEIAHHALKASHRKRFIVFLGVTIALAFAFLYCQAAEYAHAWNEMGLTLSSVIYGSTFYMLTGFHGFHVLIGTVMLVVMFLRAIKGHFRADDHFGFEAAAWYWHFVDVVWVALVIVVYVI